MNLLPGVQEALRERLPEQKADALHDALEWCVGDRLCDLEGYIQDVAYKHGLNEPGGRWVVGLVLVSLFAGNAAVVEEAAS